jgi:hypothetical protein
MENVKEPGCGAARRNQASLHSPQLTYFEIYRFTRLTCLSIRYTLIPNLIDLFVKKVGGFNR